jgi:hypothetical protein
MNYTLLDDAYKIHHIDSSTYTKPIIYSTICIYCSHKSSMSLMNDGGSFRQCERCRKNFKATILTDPINNFTKSLRQ